MMEYSKKSAEISLKFLNKFKEKFKNEIDWSSKRYRCYL
jgi:hypothetical protein